MKNSLRWMLCVLLILSLFSYMTACSSDDSGNSKDMGSDSTETVENTYETPLKAYAEYMSGPGSDLDKEMKVYNGWAEEEIKEIHTILKKLWPEDGPEVWERAWHLSVMNGSYEDQFGKDAKMSYVIDEKVELSKEDLEKYQQELDGLVKKWEEDWADGGPESDVTEWIEAGAISEADGKKLLDVFEAFIDKMGEAQIEEGYKLSTSVTISGSELEEDYEKKRSFLVFKVDGRWVLQLTDQSVMPVCYRMYVLGFY